MFVAGATPITFIGDSHSLGYADLVFKDARGELVVTRSHYCRGLTAKEFCADGELASVVVQALLADGFVEQKPPRLVARHRAMDNHAIQVGVAMQRARGAPVLVFSVGDIDLKFGFIREFAAGDFELPAAYAFDPSPFPAQSARERVPFALAAGFARRMLAPYLRGLVTLARLGFEHVYVHALPPGTLDDDAFEKMNGFRAPARLRYKATRLFNAVLRDFARDYPEFVFVDVWDRVTTQGVLDPAYHLDDSHLNRRGAVLAVGDILADLERRAAAAGTASAGTPLPRADSAIGARFAQDGIFAVDLGRDAAAALRAGLTFAPDPDGAYVRADWAGEGLGGSRFVAAVRPDASFVARCAAGLGAGAVHDAIADCVGADFAIPSLRVLKTLAPEDAALGIPPLFARGGTPAGSVRGILYLTGVAAADDPLTFAARNGAPTHLRPEPGTLVLYDPQRVDHRESVANAETVDLLFVPRRPDEPARVVGAGSNHFWPLDPAAFATAGLVIAPLG